MIAYAVHELTHLAFHLSTFARLHHGCAYFLVSYFLVYRERKHPSRNKIPVPTNTTRFRQPARWTTTGSPSSSQTRVTSRRRSTCIPTTRYTISSCDTASTCAQNAAARDHGKSSSATKARTQVIRYWQILSEQSRLTFSGSR